MSQNDDTRDEELLARYRRAGADAPGPSDAVRAAILAESRRVADELAKQAPRQPFDVSRPVANDSRWKITAFGTAGAALLAALLFAPRYWENAPPAQVSMAPPPAPAPASMSAPAPAPAPKSEAPELADVKPSESTYAAAARLRSPDLSAGAASDALSETGGLPSRGESLLKPATLQSAVAQGDVAQTAMLLDQGAVIDARDAAGRTPLMLAVTQGRLEIVRLLLARGADPNAADNTGRTPLQQARLQNLREIAALLEGWQRARSAQ